MEQHSEEPSPRRSLQGLALLTALLALPAASAELAVLHGLVPMAVMYHLVLFGHKQGSALVAAALLLAAALTYGFGSLPALLFAITLVPAGIFLALGIERNEPPGQTGLKGAASLGALWLLLGAWYGSRHGVNPYQEILTGLEQGFQQTLEFYRTKAELPAATLKELTIALETARRFLAKALPAVIVNTIIATVWLNLLAGTWLLQKTRPQLVRWQEFKNWRLPESLVWLVIVALALMVGNREPLVTIGLNGGYVLGLLYCMQGLAVLAHSLARWQLPRPFRGLIYVLLLMQFYGLLLLAVVGLAETWLALRQKPTRPAGGA
ncbi:MAG: DUF2232 domain-containing protein [Thermodesulfobacteriota bacterium]